MLHLTRCCRGSLSSLYLQVFCQLPNDAGLTINSIFAGDLLTTRWCRRLPAVYLQTVANYPLMQGSLSPFSIFACGLSTTRWYQGSWYLCICRMVANYPMMQGSLSPLSIFACGLLTTLWYQDSLSSVCLQTVANYPMMPDSP
jgi:hypothetical protein